MSEQINYVIKRKYFSELTTTELYEILRTRAEIFVVEQDCVYQDLDGRDYNSLHVFFEGADGKVLACLRIFEKPDEENVMVIGRVVSLIHGVGLGGALLHEAVRIIDANYGGKEVYMEAQMYATGYYAKEGFEITSGEFLEDGIPHVEMRRPARKY